jgi:hypothetical protein
LSFFSHLFRPSEIVSDLKIAASELTSRKYRVFRFFAFLSASMTSGNLKCPVILTVMVLKQDSSMRPKRNTGHPAAACGETNTLRQNNVSRSMSKQISSKQETQWVFDGRYLASRAAYGVWAGVPAN